MNRIILMGRIANDLELKMTPNGVSCCQFRLAVDRQYQKKGEERVTDFFNITAWRTTAEFITRNFSKGNLILIEGELQTRQYIDRNGNPNTWYEIMLENVYFTGEKRGQATNAAPPAQPTQQYNQSAAPRQTTAPAPQSYGNTNNDYPTPPSGADDDYPF